MMDHLIGHLESHPEYRVFHLDGQTIVLEDYTDIRPTMRDRLARLIGDGRVIVGPWYVMPDEFLASGEALVRNLQRGISLSREWGAEPMRSGYVTDIFGHNSQMPQILRGFGIDNAVLYRGIGDYPKDLFVWRGADGATVLTVKLDRERSYSNFYFTARWPFDGRPFDDDELVRRMEGLIDFSAPLAVSSNIIMMDGVDQIEIEPELPRMIALLNDRLPNARVLHSTLDEFIAAQRTHSDRCEIIDGELYRTADRGVNNQLLKNVLSSMVHLKQLNDRAEQLLTRWAEPYDAFAALSSIAGGGVRQACTDICVENSGFFGKAWDLVIANHAHDSIGGCSISEVHEDNVNRFKQAIEIGEDVLDDALDRLTANRPDVRGRRRVESAPPAGGRQEAVGAPESSTPPPGEGSYELVVYSARPQSTTETVITTVDVPAGHYPILRLYGADGALVPFQLLDVARSRFRKQLTFGKLADYPRVDAYTIAFEASLAAYGYARFRYDVLPIAGPGPGEYAFRIYNAPHRHVGSMRCADMTWENGRLSVTVENDGTFTVKDIATGREYRGVHRFEDSADVGDGWNWRPALGGRTIRSDGTATTVSIVADGPLAVVWEIRYAIDLPASIAPDRTHRSSDLVRHEITTRATLRRNARTIEFSTSLENRAKDHRLRVLFPTGLAGADEFATTTPFALEPRPVVIERNIEALELETDVFPNQGVVAISDGVSGVGVFNRGLYEVGVGEDADRTIALTLLRSFGTETRREEASMGYLLQPLSFSYAIGFYDGQTSLSTIASEGDGWRVGRRSRCLPHADVLPHIAQSHSFLEVANRAVAISAIYHDGDATFLRLFNLERTPQTTAVSIGFEVDSAWLTRLDGSGGTQIEVVGNTLQLSFEPAQVVTIRLETLGSPTAGDGHVNEAERV